MSEEKFQWKCDICGTRFNNFQAEGFNRKIYCPLCFFKELNKQNEQQLQAYKDKEDKEPIDTQGYEMYINELLKYKKCWEELKQISQNDDEGRITAHDFLWFLEKTIEELEQKYELGE